MRLRYWRIADGRTLDRHALVTADGAERPGEYCRLEDALDAAAVVDCTVITRTYQLVAERIVWEPGGPRPTTITGGEERRLCARPSPTTGG